MIINGECGQFNPLLLECRSALPRSCPTFCTAAENDGGGEKTTSKRNMEGMVGMIMAACNAEKIIAQAIGSVPA